MLPQYYQCYIEQIKEHMQYVKTRYAVFLFLVIHLFPVEL